jgi:hypothetical protein
MAVKVLCLFLTTVMEIADDRAFAPSASQRDLPIHAAK